MKLFGNIFESNGWSFQEPPIYRSLFVSEEYALETLKEWKEPLSLQESARCLKKAMQDCSLEVFRQLLDRCQSAECMENYQIAPSEDFELKISGSGSMLMLAAMMDRPRHAQLLLERGYDCNGANMNLANQNHGMRVTHLYTRFSGGAEAMLSLMSTKQIWSTPIYCATPLAAALLCGSLQTAEVLLQEKNIWKAESSAVCRAAAMILEGMTRHLLTEEQQRNQLEILRQIFCPELAQLPDRETFLRRVYLQPASYVDFCSTQMLRYQLEAGLYTEQDILQILLVLHSEQNEWMRQPVTCNKSGKLLILKKYFPSVCRTPWVTGIFLQEAVRRIQEGEPYRTLLTAWKQLCGKERDLTWANYQLWNMEWRQLEQFLEEAGKDGQLILDADAVDHGMDICQRGMIKLLKMVEFRYWDNGEVSGLMRHLINCGDLRILKEAVKAGFFDYEDPVQLLECMDSSARQDVRALILTYARKLPRENQQKEDWQDPRRWELWRRWKDLEEQDVQDSLRMLLNRKLPRKDCLWAMFRLYQYWKRYGVFGEMTVCHATYSTLSVKSLAGLACCANSEQILALLREYLPETLLQPIHVCWDSNFYFVGSPLALSAALGKTEQVRLLLEDGVHPDEVGQGNLSRFVIREKDFSEVATTVTPLLAAILFGQEETAQLLLKAGATCDFSRPEHWRVLLQGSAESLRLAQRLPGVGLEKVPAEELEQLRMITGENGERTCFWNHLRQAS